MSYDDWLEQPRAEADDARQRAEAIDEWLGDEFDEACRTRHDCDLAAGLMHVVNAADILDTITGLEYGYLSIREIILASAGASPHTVETAVAAMLDAARKAWVSDTDNRQRAAQCIAEAMVRGGDNG